MESRDYTLSEIDEEDVKTYRPGEILKVYEWYCENCEEAIGYPYIEDTHAMVCEDAAECPKSIEWDGDACGYVVCKWCHEPAVERIYVCDGEEADRVAEEIGVEAPE
jgi:hypothetical protein